MDTKELRYIVECLPRGRTLFYYYKDLYALKLLSYAVGKEGKKVSEIKASRYARLTDKPRVKEHLSRLGTNKITKEYIDSIWPATKPSEYECYSLSLDKWGDEKLWLRDRDYNQTARPGYNLVLQLNFSSKHNKEYKKIINPATKWDHYASYGHPVADNGRLLTLAWARMDIDMEKGEALIEEVQNDWIRNALRDFKSLAKVCLDEKGNREIRLKEKSRYGFPARAVSRYFNDTLAFHKEIWDEAMFTAALWFIREELGIKTIYMHTHETGNVIKNLSRDFAPPRSVYEKLPKKFCFEKIKEVPDFLRKYYSRNYKKIFGNISPSFWKLSL